MSQNQQDHQENNQPDNSDRQQNRQQGGQPQPGNKPQSAHNEHETAPDQKPIKKGHALIVLLIVLAALAVLAVIGILARRHSSENLTERTNDLAAPSVIAITPKPGDPIQELVLPGNVTSYTDSPVYARTSGYLTHWYFDIGAKVRKGTLLADIASPEVDQQVAQGEADLNTAKATANNARTQADRYKNLVTSNAVSQQDTDTFVNQANSTQAQVQSSEANLRRLKELQSFEKVYAPFDGVVTARNVDTGQLVDTGTSKELFHIQAVQTLRIFTNLPGTFSSSAHKGDTIDLTFAEHPGQTFHGKLVRTADAIDPASRTLLVEIDIDNRDGKLFAGTLAQVHFKVDATAAPFVLPVSVLIFRNNGMQVGVIHDNTAHLVPVTIGQDDGKTVQIITGLNQDDKVIQDPPDSLVEGEKLHVLSPQEVKAAAGQGGNQ